VIFFKKRKRYDMNMFLELVEKEAEKIEIDYLSVSVEITNAKGEYELEFRCYLNDYDFYHGKTIHESLKKLKAAIRQRKAKPKKPMTKVPRVSVRVR